MTSTKKPRISIIGCGWLGKPLFQTLFKQYEVFCSTRQKEESSFENYCYNPPQSSSFWDCDYAIVAISTKDNYLETLKQIAAYVNSEAVVILLSSISVYREYDGEVDEETPITQTGKQYEAEILMQRLRKKLIVLRLGGLMGEDRISGKWSKVSTFEDGPVNYVHRDDVIGIIQKILLKKTSSGIFNVVAPQHPLRSAIHRSNAEKFGFKPGRFEGMTRRKILSKKVVEYLKYEFIYPDPLRFW
ncbi:hypothetical protein [Sulfurimonas sp. HSL-1716]|uniref:hypothetical protein n=1 Tax=Hydrocurvibacter sulfurireducens TaxID=3131937 RepID=UPI0031F86148